VFERFGDPTDEVHGEKVIRRFCKFDDSNKVITDSDPESVIDVER
jgi:hypothetical protein